MKIEISTQRESHAQITYEKKENNNLCKMKWKTLNGFQFDKNRFHVIAPVYFALCAFTAMHLIFIVRINYHNLREHCEMPFRIFYEIENWMSLQRTHRRRKENSNSTLRQISNGMMFCEIQDVKYSFVLTLSHFH